MAMVKKKAKVKQIKSDIKPMGSVLGEALSAANPVYKSADFSSSVQSVLDKGPSLSTPTSNVYGGGLKPSDVNVFAANSPSLSNIADQTAIKEKLSAKVKPTGYSEGSAFTLEGGYAPVKKNEKGVYTEQAVQDAVNKSKAKARVGRKPQSESPAKATSKVLKLTGDQKKLYEEFINKKKKK